MPAPAADTSPEGPPRWTLTVRTAVEAAHGTLQEALRDLGGSVHDIDALLEPDRWAEEGGPLGRLYAGAHRLSSAERERLEAREFARDRVHAAAGAYARALRRDGIGLPAALVAVRGTVDDAVARDRAALSPADVTRLQGDAARCCLEAFYAH